MPIEGLFPEGDEMPQSFPEKKIIFLSSRVHPGESPAAHMLEGLVDFLLESENI
jgi:hypothetical protein